MGQNWIHVNGALVNNEVADVLDQMNLFVVYVDHDGDEDGDALGDSRCAAGGKTITFDADPRLYPWAASFAPRTCTCRTGTCSCARGIVLHQALHQFVWDTLKGVTDPRRRGQVVHHRNENKHDARLKNLSKGTRAAHARAHLARRQKFAPRERHDLGGLYRPQQPSRVVTRHDMIGTIVMPEQKLPRMLSKLQRVDAMVTRLAPRWSVLSAQLAYLDSGEAVPRRAPRAAWDSPKTRKMGLRMPQLELSPGEAVYVLLLVKWHFDKARAATDAGEEPELLDVLWKRPAVSQAISNWRDRRRLPLAK